jgi:P27 family predicted phage terminase small subunit
MGARGPKSESQSKFHRIYPERPKPPRGLTGGARKLWRQIIDSLPSDYFKKAELGLLSAYVQAAHLHTEAMKEVQELGLVLEMGEKGYKVVNPALVIANKQAMLMSTLATKLRLCPNSRISKSTASTTRDRRPSTRPGLMFGGEYED